MKLAIQEIGAACALIRADGCSRPSRLLARVARIFEQLNNAWDVLRTMTPSDYSEFRDRLGQSSGFQSWQYRAIEFLAGNRNLAMLRPQEHRPEIVAELNAHPRASRASISRRSLLLRRRGLDVGDAAQRAEAAEPHVEMRSVLTNAWAAVYRDPGDILDALRAGRKADRLRGLFPPLALQPRHDGRARHRPQAGHGRHVGRRLSQAHARGRAVPGALAGAHADVTDRRQAGAGLGPLHFFGTRQAIPRL